MTNLKVYKAIWPGNFRIHVYVHFQVKKITRNRN